MRLAINLGNTHAQIGLDGLQELHKGPALAPRELLDFIPIERVSEAWIASVNREASAAWQAALWQVPVRFLTWAPELGLPTVYADPSKIGADRLANAVALLEQGELPAVAVDAGTAITFEVVDREGVFRGGPILPGPTLMARALHSNTSLLPEVDPFDGAPQAIPGGGTAEAIRAGVRFAATGAVERILGEIEAALGETPRVILTGGGAASLGLAYDEAPELTLRGLLVAADRLG